MDKRRVLYELSEWTVDPFDSEICMKLINDIEDETPFGRILISLLKFAENGNFR